MHMYYNFRFNFFPSALQQLLLLVICKRGRGFSLLCNEIKILITLFLYILNRTLKYNVNFRLSIAYFLARAQTTPRIYVSLWFILFLSKMGYHRWLSIIFEVVFLHVENSREVVLINQSIAKTQNGTFKEIMI